MKTINCGYCGFTSIFKDHESHTTCRECKRDYPKGYIPPEDNTSTPYPADSIEGKLDRIIRILDNTDFPSITRRLKTIETKIDELKRHHGMSIWGEVYGDDEWGG